MDSSIKNETVNDFSVLLADLLQLKLICFNGCKAAQMWKKYINYAGEGLAFITLPSTSPMVGKNVKSLSEKEEAWAVIRAYLLQ